MNRRDTFRLIPLTLAGIGNYIKEVAALESNNSTDTVNSSIPRAMKYSENIKDMLTWVRQNQAEKILESAYIIARTVLKGRTCWSIWDQGHTYHSDIFPGRNGEPEILTAGYDPKKAVNGDLFLCSFNTSLEVLEDISKKDIFVVACPTPWGGDAIGYELVTKEIQEQKIRPHADIWIETNITTRGAKIWIPGMPAPIGPVSGPLYMTIMWMMLADACRVLSREGKSINVKGDEPKLSGTQINWESLSDPLMEDFLDMTFMEMELIGAEFGDLRKIASMAVDTLLNGGTVYYYSRYPEAFAQEAQWRRGGLNFARALSDGSIKGTSKDCVIMGIYKPDDEADLRNLDEFKKLGMRVASVGPITRDFRVPEGRTVHKETEVHIGRMCDTYGMFAIPGFNQKVCPTSGILNCTMLWTIAIEIVEQVRERTGGNLPGVRTSSALKWGRTLNTRMDTMLMDRGY